MRTYAQLSQGKILPKIVEEKIRKYTGRFTM